jgi:hypothetical protein
VAKIVYKSTNVIIDRVTDEREVNGNYPHDIEEPITTEFMKYIQRNEENEQAFQSQDKAAL